MDKKKQYSGQLGDCSEEQLKALEKFREFANSKGLSAVEFDDHYLLRFLRSRRFVVADTIVKFNGFLEWRIKNDVQNIQSYIFHELPEVREHYAHGYYNTDKIGRPIYIERIGMLKLSALFSVTSEERLIKYYIQSYEQLLKRIFPACSQAAGKRIYETVTILDLKGFSMKMLSKQVYNFVQLASRVAQDNYPEILGRMFIINAPMLFSGVWAVMKPWIDEKTREKISIIGSGYLDKLLEVIDINSLPEFLGGKCKAPLSSNQGPWNPNGQTPLFPCEYQSIEGSEQSSDKLSQVSTQISNEDGKSVQDNEQNANGEEEGGDDDDEDNSDAMNLAALRSALSGNISGPFSKAPHNSDKYELTTQGAKFQVSDTPLNTQAEEEN